MFPAQNKLKIFVGVISILTAILNRRKLSDLRSLSVSLKLAQPLITKLVLRFRPFLSEISSSFLSQSKNAIATLLKFIATFRSFRLSDKMIFYVKKFLATFRSFRLSDTIILYLNSLYHKLLPLLPSFKNSAPSEDISIYADYIKKAQIIHDESYELMKLWKSENKGYEQTNADYRELKEDLVRAYDNLMLSKSLFIEFIGYHHDLATGKRALPINEGIIS
jgi:hypothetical protein